MLKNSLGGFKVMLVDDHKLVSHTLMVMLKEYKNIDVVANVSSGEEAIQVARRLSRLDLVLMDIHMPGMGGLEATRKLIRIRKHLKVLIVTACHKLVFVQTVLEAGAVGYIVL